MALVNELLLQLERLALEGNWDCLQPYLNAMRQRAGQEEALRAQLMQSRFEAGHCVMCGRAPCADCGKKNAFWCDVCWDLIKKNCPEGKVVSGLAVVVQAITRGGGGRNSERKARTV